MKRASQSFTLVAQSLKKCMWVSNLIVMSIVSLTYCSPGDMAGDLFYCVFNQIGLNTSSVCHDVVRVSWGILFVMGAKSLFPRVASSKAAGKPGCTRVTTLYPTSV